MKTLQKLDKVWIQQISILVPHGRLEIEKRCFSIFGLG